MERNAIIQGDCLGILSKLEDNSIDVAFADPPFNIGYEYDQYDDTRSKQDYLDWTESWLEEVRRVLKPTGSFFVAIGDEYAAEMKVRLDQLGLTMRELDHLALHLRRELHVEIQPKSRSYLLLCRRSETVQILPG